MELNLPSLLDKEKIDPLRCNEPLKIFLSFLKEAPMTEQQKLAEELKKMDYEPLLPVEKKLIRWSICLGVGLLFLLYWLSITLFPAGH
jgi:hypothetical protein